MELTLSERIWGVLQGAVAAAIAEILGLTDEEVFDGLSANVSFNHNMLLLTILKLLEVVAKLE